DVDEAAKLMRDHQIRRLPILSQEKMLVGIVALGDLATDTSPRLSGITLKSVSEPSVPVG
ncbi:MAG TPA: CBS domain-containing protein, partial [Gemmata sp.]|nr:CBS domain-containing protein [Gemmata sp.]